MQSLNSIRFNLFPHLFLLIISIFLLFYKLDHQALYLWDESRLAVKACEMIEGGHYVVPHFHGEPDMWSLKPPLMIWLQVFSIKVFGVNEFAVRFPSAVMGFLTILLMYVFSIKFLKSSSIGLWASFILLTSLGYMEVHAVRNGEYEALLTFFLLSGALNWFLYLENIQDGNQYLWLSAISIGLGVLSKSVAGLLFLPGICLYTLFSGKLRSILTDRTFWLAVPVSIGIFIWYYLLREHLNPGYLQAVYDNELFGRFGGVIEGHQAPATFYIKDLFGDFLFWLSFLPISLWGLLWAKAKERRLMIFLLSTGISYLLLISFGQTKLEWYEIPLYPVMGLLMAMGLQAIFRKIASSLLVPAYEWVFSILFLLMIYPFPVMKMWNTINKDMIDGEYMQKFLAQNSYGEFFNKKAVPDTTWLLYRGYSAHTYFYQYKLKAEGKEIYMWGPDLARVGDVALVCEDPFKAELKERAHLTIMDSLYNCILVRVDSLK
ncbi:MAG: glycosyltransferase family 39 protein [Bacteroidota bacterium]